MPTSDSRAVSPNEELVVDTGVGEFLEHPFSTLIATDLITSVKTCSLCRLPQTLRDQSYKLLEDNGMLG